MWDTKNPFVAGLPALGSVAGPREWRAIERYANFLASRDPALWTIEAQHEGLAQDILGVGATAPYQRLRFHLFRTLSVLSGTFGASAPPPVGKRDWRLLCTGLPGTGRNAEAVSLRRWSAATHAVTHVNESLSRDFHSSDLPAWDLYDLSCALCMVGGAKAQWHRDSFKPFSVKSPVVPLSHFIDRRSAAALAAPRPGVASSAAAGRWARRGRATGAARSVAAKASGDASSKLTPRND